MSYDYGDDPWGDKEMERQKWESPNSTNYRHWEEENEKSIKETGRPIVYKPLDDYWDPDRDDFNH